MDFTSLFREFGYPALVSGVLLFGYMRLRDAIVDLTICVKHLTHTVNELRKDFDRLQQAVKDG